MTPVTTSIPGKAVDGILRLARFPADRLLKVAPETGATAAVGLAIDRADAAVRGAAGSALSDHGLREDAERRRAAADERERAMRLRAEARERAATAEAQTDEKQAESVARRKQADKEAEQKRSQAAKQRERLKEQAAKTATKRKQAAQAKAEKSEEDAEKRGNVDRLEQLEKKSDALEVKDAAVRAADEARRIEEAAAATKEQRKATRAARGNQPAQDSAVAPPQARNKLEEASVTPKRKLSELPETIQRNPGPAAAAGGAVVLVMVVWRRRR